MLILVFKGHAPGARSYYRGSTLMTYVLLSRRCRLSSAADGRSFIARSRSHPSAALRQSVAGCPVPVAFAAVAAHGTVARCIAPGGVAAHPRSSAHAEVLIKAAFSPGKMPFEPELMALGPRLAVAHASHGCTAPAVPSGNRGQSGAGFEVLSGNGRSSFGIQYRATRCEGVCLGPHGRFCLQQPSRADAGTGDGVRDFFSLYYVAWNYTVQNQ